jgi:hypothetical protein
MGCRNTEEDTMTKKHDEEIPVLASSGNIFAGQGRPDADEALARVRLAQQIAARSSSGRP